tara:strand:- start:1240 stop:1737 length:498 start_codon:yes stop_codon:yes gene_type:complete
MKLNRRMLRSIISKEIKNINEGWSVSPGSVSELYGAGSGWGRESDWGYVNLSSIQHHYNQHKKAYGTTAEEYIKTVQKDGEHYQLDKVKEALQGEMASSGANDSMYQLMGPDGGAPLGEALSTGDLMALIMADKDPSSSYKLTRERLGMLNMSNLSAEEQNIIGM